MAAILSRPQHDFAYQPLLRADSCVAASPSLGEDI